MPGSLPHGREADAADHAAMARSCPPQERAIIAIQEALDGKSVD